MDTMIAALGLTSEEEHALRAQLHAMDVALQEELCALRDQELDIYVGSELERNGKREEIVVLLMTGSIFSSSYPCCGA